jgi:RNA polymerase sigma-70 factor (ECF subfamily)
VGAETPERLLWLPGISSERVRVLSTSDASREKTFVSDEELLARARAHDSTAVATLFDRYSRLVLGIGLRILHDGGEAEDLVQEVFLRLCERTNTFDPTKGGARTWMVQFAYRRACDRRSYLARRHFYNGTDLDGVKNAIQGGIGPEEEVAARVTGAQLAAAMEELNEKQRKTLQLYFFEGCDLREVAEQLGESFENIRHYYYRGLERLRRSAVALTLRNEK